MEARSSLGSWPVVAARLQGLLPNRRVAIDGHDKTCDYRSEVLWDATGLGIEYQHIQLNNSWMIGYYKRDYIVDS